MALEELPNNFDDCDEVVISTTRCVSDMTDVCGLDDIICYPFITGLFNLLTMVGGINGAVLYEYLMAGIAVCIVFCMGLENIHRIVRRRKTVAVAEEINLVKGRAAGAYEWISCKQFKWIAIALFVLYGWFGDSEDELQGLVNVFMGYMTLVACHTALKLINNAFIIYTFDVECEILLYHLIVTAALGVSVIMFGCYYSTLDDSSMNGKYGIC